MIGFGLSGVSLQQKQRDPVRFSKSGGSSIPKQALSLHTDKARAGILSPPLRR